MRTISTLLLVSVGCAAPTAPPEPSTGAPVEQRVLVPSVLPTAPMRAFIDLGPVLVHSKQHAADPTELLLAEGDRLRADAFILEGRGIHEVYATGASGDASSSERVTSLVLASLLTGSIVLQMADNSSDRRTSGFYRAIRYLDDDGDPVDLSTVDVSKKARVALAAVRSMRAQYHTALNMFLDGDLGAADYERIRRRLAGT